MAHAYVGRAVVTTRHHDDADTLAIETPEARRSRRRKRQRLRMIETIKALEEIAQRRPPENGRVIDLGVRIARKLQP